MDAKRPVLVNMGRQVKRVRYLGPKIWMRSIKPSLKNLLKRGAYAGAVLVAVTILLFSAYYASLWAAFGFNPHFIYIDACLDLGGAWNYDAQECEGSASYAEWDEHS